MIIRELTVPIILVFGQGRLKIMETWDNKIDCSIVTKLNVLLKLRNCQQLMLLIQHDVVEMDGDLQVAKNFITLIELVEFDLAELFAPYIGDFFAESIDILIHCGSTFLFTIIQRLRLYATEVLIEEWCIAPGSLEVSWFAEEITNITYVTENLIKRLERLEKNNDTR